MIPTVRPCEGSHVIESDQCPLDTVAWGTWTSETASQPSVYDAEDLNAGEEPEGMFPGPATLWGILLSELSPPKAVTDRLRNFSFSDLPERDTVINIWGGAGYDCQLLAEFYAASTDVTDAMPIDDEEPMQTSQFPGPPIGPYVVKTSPGKGQGVFAARDIRRGERILVDKPFFYVTRPYGKRKVLAEFELLPLPARQQYMQLYCPDRFDDQYMTDVMRIFEANCFNTGDGATMFLTATRFNHSCLPNTFYSWNEERNEIVVQSMIDISAGDEITICYGYAFQPCLDRQSELRMYNFWCNCPACQTESAFGQDSESRRLEMRALNEQISAFQANFNNALMTYGFQDPLTAVFRLIEVIKQEGLHGELMMPYRRAADCLRMRGNIEDALQFAYLALEEEEVCLGKDSAVVLKTIEYIEELERVLEEAKEEEEYEYDDDAVQIRWQALLERIRDLNADTQELNEGPEDMPEEGTLKGLTADIRTPQRQPHHEPEDCDASVADFEAAVNEIGGSNEEQIEDH